MSPRDSSRISPTAHYTGYVWTRHGLSPRRFETRTGKLMFHALAPVVRLASLGTGGMTIETFLVQRHRLIDAILARAIERGQVGQVVEIGGGLSGRGLRLSEQYHDRGLIYVEGDLPAMARRKRSLLAQGGPSRPHHHVVEMDGLAHTGPLALAQAVRPWLDPERGTALVTEGLLNYFDAAAVADMWRRFAELLAGFPHGLYLTDIHLARGANQRAVARAFVWALGVFARGRIHLHFESPAALERAARSAGFAASRLEHPSTWAADLALPGLGLPENVVVLQARVEADAASSG